MSSMLLYQPIPLSEAQQKALELQYEKGRVQNYLGKDHKIYKSVFQVCNKVESMSLPIMRYGKTSAR